MAELRHVYGDVLRPQKIYGDDELVVIPHCCNNIGVMGAGVALQIARKYPELVASYFAQHKSSGTDEVSGLKNMLGEVFFGLEDSGKLLIANMIGQDGTRGPGNEKPVKYWALLRGMQETLAYAGGCKMRSDKVVFHCPKFGSDLAGGDWNVIEALIQETWVDRGFDVVVYEWEPDENKWGPVDEVLEIKKVEDEIEDMFNE